MKKHVLFSFAVGVALLATQPVFGMEVSECAPVPSIGAYAAHSCPRSTERSFEDDWGITDSNELAAAVVAAQAVRKKAEEEAVRSGDKVKKRDEVPSWYASAGSLAGEDF